ncbi:MAG: hypothetical protein AAGC74_12375 [Verrucomicrobiota bacterium]
MVAPRERPLLKRISWRFEYLAYRLFEALFKPLPIEATVYLGRAIGFLFYDLSPRYRRLVTRNLFTAYGHELSQEQIQKLARQTCQDTIANFLGTLKTTILPASTIDSHIEFENRDSLLAHLSTGQGALLILGHMGNWELLNRLYHQLPPGTPAGGVYQPLKNPLVDQHLLARRQQDGSRLFSKRDGFHAPASFVKDGGLLIVVADQRVGKSGTAIPFFNRLSSLSPLPAMLARKAKCPVFAAGIATTKPGHWKITFQEVPKPLDTPNIIQTLESLIHLSPSDYLWLHNRWKLSGYHPLSLDSRPIKNQPPYPHTKPLRILALTNNPPTTETLNHTLSQRSPHDLPLDFRFLPTKEDPTPEQLAAEIESLNQSTPFELLLILEPNPLTQKISKLTHLPKTISNHKGLSFPDFIASLSSTTLT